MLKTIKQVGKDLRDAGIEAIDSAIEGLENMAATKLQEIEIADWVRALDRVRICRLNFREHIETLPVILSDDELRKECREVSARLRSLQVNIDRRLADSERKKKLDVVEGA